MGRKRPEPRPAPRRSPLPGPDDGPPLARATDPQTSHDAAEAARRRRMSQCLRMLQAYGAAGTRGCTADEAAEYAGLRDPGRNVCYWHRASDLRDKLLITSLDPPRRRLGFSGHSQDVKVITEAGKLALALMIIPADTPRKANT